MFCNIFFLGPYAMAYITVYVEWFHPLYLSE
uniref:Uncharacterized protein n=1 Tax=Anguilla anguilla TaxID=7936 RepID=A0A0E9RAX8_ANGAN